MSPPPLLATSTVGDDLTSRGNTLASESKHPATVTEWLAIAYVTVLPFDGLAIGYRSLPFIVSALFLASYALAFLRGSLRPGGATVPMIVPAAAFVTYCATTYYWSIWTDGTLQQIQILSVMVITSWALSKPFALYSYPIAVGYIVGAIGMSTFVLLSPPSTYDDRRTAYGNANDVAVILLVGAALAFYLVMKRRGTHRLIAFLGLPIIVAGTISTGSRTAAFGGAALGLVILISLMYRRAWRQFIAVMVAAGLITLVLVNLPNTFLPHRLFDIATALESSTLSNRTILWHAILSRGDDAFGFGFGATPAFLGNLGGSVAHNVYLSVLAETGWLGVVIFAAFITRLVLDGTRSRSPLLFLLAGTPVAVATLTLSLETSRVFWFVVALAWALPRSRHIPPVKSR